MDRPVSTPIRAKATTAKSHETENILAMPGIVRPAVGLRIAAHRRRANHVNSPDEYDPRDGRGPGSGDVQDPGGDRELSVKRTTRWTWARNEGDNYSFHLKTWRCGLCIT